MSNIELHESFYRFSKGRTRFFVFVCCGGRKNRCICIIFSLRVKAVDMPENNFPFTRGFGEDKVVVEFYTVDVVGVDGCGREVWVGVTFRKIGCCGDGVDGGGEASGLGVEDGENPETYCVVHTS